MNIVKTQLPVDSILNKLGNKYDYVDSFKGQIRTHRDFTPTEVGRAFFSSAPDWVEKLMGLRNKIVGVFGLKTSNKNPLSREEPFDNFKCEPNERLGLFKIFNKTDKEVILGEDDKHLDFRVSLFLENSSTNKFLTISTTVKFNNWLGRIYFLPVQPFHRFIVPAMLKSIIKELEKC